MFCYPYVIMVIDLVIKWMNKISKLIKVYTRTLHRCKGYNFLKYQEILCGADYLMLEPNLEPAQLLHRPSIWVSAFHSARLVSFISNR